FNANSKSKQERCLAMLDERFAKRIEDIEQVVASEGSAAQKARRGGDQFARMLAADPEWERLFFEFSAYAARDEEFREELLTRYRAMRDQIAHALSAHANGEGKEKGTLSFDEVALLICIMGNGFALEKLLEGDAVPDELYGTLLTIFFAGLEALKDASLETAGAAAVAA